MPSTIADRTILVTGANRGIGRALVTEALHQGARRVYAATRGSATHPDPRVVPLTLDVIDDSQIHAAAAQVDTLDILINNADIVLYDDLTDRARLERTLAVNLLGTYTVTQAFVPLLDNGEDDVFPDRMSASLAASWRSRAAMRSSARTLPSPRRCSPGRRQSRPSQQTLSILSNPLDSEQHEELTTSPTMLTHELAPKRSARFQPRPATTAEATARRFPTPTPLSNALSPKFWLGRRRVEMSNIA